MSLPPQPPPVPQPPASSGVVVTATPTQGHGCYSDAAGPIPHWPGESVSLGGYEVFVRSVPASAGEPALCVHGLAGSSRNWTDLMDLLRPRLDCAALDLPGFGRSEPRPDRRYTIDAMAQTTAALIERQGRGPVHLIGNSMGGAVCVRLAARRPELIRTLTLISPALPDLQPRMDLIRFPVMSMPKVGGWALSKFKTLSPEQRVWNVMVTCYFDPAAAPAERIAGEAEELARRDTLSYADEAMIGCMRSLTTESLRTGPLSPWRDAVRCTMPTLVLYGRNDRVVSPRHAGKAARLFPDSRVVVLPRTGHLAQMEHPEAVLAEMAIMLGGIPAGSGRLAVSTDPSEKHGEHSVAAPAG
jgi:pimeloyl-ACP methyl ester carboxylesterase